MHFYTDTEIFFKHVTYFCLACKLSEVGPRYYSSGGDASCITFSQVL